jgi:uncharacterized protein (UPF0179 family)
MSISEILKKYDGAGCTLCPLLDICTELEPGAIVRITNEMVRRSNCDGAFVDAFEDVPVQETYFDGTEITIGPITSDILGV